MTGKIDPQTPGTIQGYRTHTQDDIDLVNRIKAMETDVAKLWKDVRAHDATDRRMLALARTNIEDGFMWLVRAVFQPETEFDRD